MNSLPLFPLNVARAMTHAVRRQGLHARSAVRVAQVEASRAKITRRLMVLGSGAVAVILSQEAHCAGFDKDIAAAIGKVTEVFTGVTGSGGDDGDDGKGPNNDPFKAIIEKYADVVTQLGFSGAMGVCSAMALKRVSRQAAVAVGFVFAGLQALAYAGYININYKKVSDDAQRALDVTGDGKFDSKDIKVLWERLYDILAYQLPNAGGFASGFAMGFYYI